MAEEQKQPNRYPLNPIGGWIGKLSIWAKMYRMTITNADMVGNGPNRAYDLPLCVTSIIYSDPHWNTPADFTTASIYKALDDVEASIARSHNLFRGHLAMLDENIAKRKLNLNSK